MKIQYFGHSCFALENSAGTVVLTDPYGDVGFDLPCVHADVVTISHHHFDHDNAAAIKGAKVFDQTGEYELGGIGFCATKSWHDEVRGAKRGENLIFEYLIDGIRICHLGDIGVKAEEIPSDLHPDILLIPVGGNYTIDAEEAKRYIEKLSPAVVIPMHFKTEGLQVDIEGIERFLSLFDCDVPIEHVGCEVEFSLETLPKSNKIIVMERKTSWI